MTIIPTMRTWLDGEIVTPTMMNEQVRDLGNLVLERPICVLGQSDHVTCNNSTWTKLTFNRVMTDSAGMYTPGTTYITCQVAGWYQCFFKVGFVVNGTGYRSCQIWKNDTETHAVDRALNISASQQTFVDTSLMIDLQVGDTLSAAAFQNSGAALDTTTGGPSNEEFESYFYTQWVRRL